MLYYAGKLLKPERLETFIKGKLGKLLDLKDGDVIRAVGGFQDGENQQCSLSASYL